MPKLLPRVRPYLPMLSPRGDGWTKPAKAMWWLTFFWLLIGLIVLFSASYYHGEVEQGDGLYYFKRQIIAALLGILAFGWLVKIPLQQITRVGSWGLLLTVALIWLTLLPGLGKSTLGATRWIALGPVQIQPSELVKPFLVLQAAKLFGQWQRWPQATKVASLGIFGLVLLGILRQPNLSTTALCGITLWLIACTAGIAARYLAITAAGGLLVAAISLAIHEYQLRRVLSFLNPWNDPQHDGFQLIQSLLAIGSGGLWGNGYGFSQQKLSYLPIQDTDFIFSVFAEEFGYLGCIALLVMIVAYATVGLNIAYHAKNMVHRLIATGAMTFIVLQSILNIGVATGALPTTGLPLPMFSYGGSSLIASLVMSALLIRVSRESAAEKVVPFRTPQEKPRESSPRPTDS
jgi:cell division protein FtsW